MTQKINQTEMLLKFKKNMKTEEKSQATIEKYLRNC